MEDKPIELTNGQQIIMRTIMVELRPPLESLKKLVVKIHKLRLSFQLYSNELLLIEKEYAEISTAFFEATRKLQSPELLFENSDNDCDMFSYMTNQGLFIPKISEGVAYIEIIDRTLDRKLQTIQNSRALVLALSALVIGLLGFYDSVFNLTKFDRYFNIIKALFWLSDIFMEVHILD